MFNSSNSGADAIDVPEARHCVTPPRDLIDEIRQHYRLAKSAEQVRIGLTQKLVAFARVHLTGWNPNSDEKERKKSADQALRVVTGIMKSTERKPYEPAEGDEDIAEVMTFPTLQSMAATRVFDDERKLRKKQAQTLCETLPAWKRIQGVKGFSSWGLAALIGECGNLSDYSGVRKVYKRLGLAPNEAYPNGEKSTGRMIPRGSRGRIVGIVFDPLLKAKAKNPYGVVYDTNKARHLVNGKTKGHAHALARRAMIKALIHDVYLAWHGEPMIYADDEPRMG